MHLWRIELFLLLGELSGDFQSHSSVCRNICRVAGGLVDHLEFIQLHGPHHVVEAIHWGNRTPGVGNVVIVT